MVLNFFLFIKLFVVFFIYQKKNLWWAMPFPTIFSCSKVYYLLFPYKYCKWMSYIYIYSPRNVYQRIVHFSGFPVAAQ